MLSRPLGTQSGKCEVLVRFAVRGRISMCGFDDSSEVPVPGDVIRVHHPAIRTNDRPGASDLPCGSAAEYDVVATGAAVTASRRSNLWGSDSQILNLAVRKNFAIQLRGEDCNVLNHPNWGNPTTSPTSAAFGRVQSKSGNREIQVAVLGELAELAFRKRRTGFG